MSTPQEIENALNATYDAVASAITGEMFDRDYDMVHRPNLYVGNAQSRSARPWAAIVSVRTQRPTSEMLRRNDTAELWIDADDRSKVMLRNRFAETRAFIAEHIVRGPVLVHCQMGISRSATIACDYILHSEPDAFEHNVARALLYMKTQRPIIHPNEGFLQQLLDEHRPQ